MYSDQPYAPNQDRYACMSYRNLGRSGLKVPALSLGLGNGFGHSHPLENQRETILNAFDLGITHFDIGDYYGPPRGTAEELFGYVMSRDLMRYRDELIVSAHTGYREPPGMESWGARKNLLESLERSLSRLRLEYVDIFYVHRYDRRTPLEETMGAVADIYRAGKCMYVGLSSYPFDKIRRAKAILKSAGVPLVAYRAPFSIFSQRGKGELLDILCDEGIGWVGLSPLFYGVLGSSALWDGLEKSPSRCDFNTREDMNAQVALLNYLAASRNQSLAQMAIAWVLQHNWVSSTVVNTSCRAHLVSDVSALEATEFTTNELEVIDSLSAHCSDWLKDVEQLF
ncbi:aldo/keto reductase [Streptomyces olivoreticuli]